MLLVTRGVAKQGNRRTGEPGELRGCEQWKCIGQTFVDTVPVNFAEASCMSVRTNSVWLSLGVPSGCGDGNWPKRRTNREVLMMSCAMESHCYGALHNFSQRGVVLAYEGALSGENGTQGLLIVSLSWTDVCGKGSTGSKLLLRGALQGWMGSSMFELYDFKLQVHPSFFRELASALVLLDVGFRSVCSEGLGLEVQVASSRLQVAILSLLVSGCRS